MTSPKHLWAGDWSEESAAARRRASPPAAQSPAAEPAPSPAPGVHPAVPRLRPPRRVLIGGAAAAFLVLVAIAVALTSGGSSPSPAATATANHGGLQGLPQGSGSPQRPQAPSSAPVFPHPSHGPWLGVQTESYPTGGVMIDAVQPGGPADAAGLAAGDVITAVGQHAIGSPDELAQTLSGLKVGQVVPVRVQRGPTTYSVQVKLAGSSGGP